MHYFYVYAKLVHKDRILFLQSDSAGQYHTVSDSGWEWELIKWSDSKSDDDPSAYYRHAGCGYMSVTGWQPVQSLSYDAST